MLEFIQILQVEQIKEKESKVQDNLIRATEEDMKALRKYIEQDNHQKRWEINELMYKAQLVNERISMYPAFKPKQVIKLMDSYLQRLKSTDDSELKETYRELIHLITMDNGEIRITLNLQRFLDAIEPIHATVIEVRNHIAHPTKHKLQRLEFSELTVQI